MRVADEAFEDGKDALALALGQGVEGFPALERGLVAEDVRELGVGDQRIEGDEEGAGDKALLRRVIDYYHATLNKSREALAYLQGRGHRFLPGPLPQGSGSPGVPCGLAQASPMRDTGSMLNQWPIFPLLCVLASLLAPVIASADWAAGAETRVLAFHIAGQIYTGKERSVTLERRQGRISDPTPGLYPGGRR